MIARAADAWAACVAGAAAAAIVWAIAKVWLVLVAAACFDAIVRAFA